MSSFCRLTVQCSVLGVALRPFGSERLLLIVVSGLESGERVEEVTRHPESWLFMHLQVEQIAACCPRPPSLITYVLDCP